VRRNYVAILLILSVVEFLPIFLAPNPPSLGGDGLGHLFKVHELMTEGWVPWIEEWYAGFPFLHFYPPAPYIIAGLLGKLFGSDVKGYAAVLMLTSFLGALGLHTYLRRLGKESYVAPVVFLLFPWRLGVAYVEGNFPRANAINLAPLFLLGVLYLTEYRERYLVLSALMISFVSLTHHSILVPLILIALVLHWDDLKSVHAIGNSLRVGGAVVFLTAFWYVPFFIDRGWTHFWDIYTDKWLFHGYSVSPSLFVRPPGVFIVALLAMAIAIGIRRQRLDPKKVILIGTCAYLSLGQYSPTREIYSLPIISLIPPYRWIDVTSVLIPLIIADSLEGMKPRLKSIAGLTLMLIVALPTAVIIPHIGPYPQNLVEIGGVLKEQHGDNWRFLMYPPIGVAYYSYLPVLSSKDTMNGWYHEGNPAGDGEWRMWSLLETGKNATPYLKAYAVRFFISCTDTAPHGYTYQRAVGGCKVYKSNVSFVQQVSTLMVGKFYDLPLDYAYVKELPKNLGGVGTIIYSGNPNNETAEELLAFIERGGTLIWAPSTPERLFGVNATTRPITSSELSSRIYNVSSFAPFRYGSSPWYGPVFSNVTPLVRMGKWTLIGVKEIGRGRLYVLGGNFLYHLAYTGSGYETKILRGFIVDENRLKVESVERGEGWYSFEIKANGPLLIRVSEAYFPYWTVKVNGSPVKAIRDDRTGLTLLEVDGDSTVVGVFRDPFTRLRHYSLLAWVILLLYAVAKFPPRRKISGPKRSGDNGP
jgi:uncharacterized membrane protein